jgi:hypothetical protein
MALKGAEQIILFDFFFIFMLATYGTTAGLEGITGFGVGFPTLAPLPGTIHCAYWDFVCNSTKDVATATAYIGWAIVNAPVIAIYFLTVIIQFFNLAEQVAFSPYFTPNGIPIIGFFFNAMQLIILFEIMRLFRGSATGL